jgi:hypothetical protein
MRLSARLAASRDMRPAAHSLSFASPKESKQRKGEPTAAPLRGSLRCSQAGGLSRKLGLEYKASDSAGKSRAYRSDPSLLRSSALHTADTTRLAAHRLGWLVWVHTSHLGWRCSIERALRARCEASCAELPVCGAEERSELGVEPYPATAAHCLRSCTQGRVCADAPVREHRKGPLVFRGALQSGRLSLLTFFGEAKKVRRPPGRNPGLWADAQAIAYPGLPAQQAQQKAKQPRTESP